MANPVTAQIVNRINNPFPAILSNLELLNKQLNFAISQIEPNGDTFGTLTAARPNAKPFIIGFIPPDNPVNFVPIASTKTQIAQINAISANDKPNKSAADLPDDFFFGIQQIAKNIPCKPEDLLAVMYNEGSAHGEHIVSDAVARTSTGSPIAKGLIQFTLASLNASKMTQDQWNNLDKTGPTSQLQFVQNYYQAVGQGKPFTSYQQLYMATFAPAKAFPDPSSLPPDTILYDDSTSFGKLAIKQNPAFSNGGTGNITVGNFFQGTKYVQSAKGYKDVVAQYNSVTSGTQASAAITGNDADIARGLMTYSNSDMLDDPLQDALGRNITVANAQRQATAAKQTSALQAQINQLAATPPLIFLINPSEFTRSYEQSTDDSPTTRYGHIVHMWLEKPMSISCSGVSAGQYIVDASGDGGLSNFYRVHSLSYQNLLSILGVYKNNGVIFAGPESDPGIPILAMSLFIYYDDHIYIGSFDDFSVNDAAEKPYNMSYSFKFSVRYDLELDGVNQTLDFAVINQLQTGAATTPTIPQANVQINPVAPSAASFAAAGVPSTV